MANNTFTNLSQVPGLKSSLGSALQNKITPQPLAPVKPNLGVFQPTSGISPMGTNGNPVSSFWNDRGPGSLSNPNSPKFAGYGDPHGLPLPKLPPATSAEIANANSSQFSPRALANSYASATSPQVAGAYYDNSGNRNPTGGMTGMNTGSSSQTGSTPPVPSASPVPPTTPTTNSTNNGYVNSSGAYVPPTGQSTQNNSATFPGFVQGLANQQNSPYNQATQQAINSSQNIANNSIDPNNQRASLNSQNAQTAQGYLQGFATNQTPAVTNAESDYNKFAQSSPYMIAAQSNPNVAADVASGRSSLLGQTFAAELGAKQQAVTNALTGQGQQISSAGTAGDQALTGQGQQINSAQNAGNLAQTGQSTAQSALGIGVNATSPHFNGYVGIDPLTGKTIGNPGGANSAAVAGSLIDSNAKSAGDIQQDTNNIQSKSDAASANFDMLNSLAQQGGVDANSPILGTIRQKFGSTVKGNNAVAGFQAQLSAVKAAYKELTGADANIPDDPTPSQLKQIQQDLNGFIQNRLNNNQKKLSDLKNGGSSGGSANDPLNIR